MAKCKDCDQEMLASSGCTEPRVRVNGTIMTRVLYDDSATPGLECHDCGCNPFHIHHFGCDMERCPACGGQFMCCKCHGKELA